MRAIEVYFGFYRPWWGLTGLFGHCDAWLYTEDDTWVFVDPGSTGLHVRVTHRHDDVQDLIAARFELCRSILRMPAREPAFRVPVHGPMTCASVCGSLVGVRAYTPWGLRRSLLRNGAEVIHEAEGKSRGQGRPAA